MYWVLSRPALSDIYLASVDRKLTSPLSRIGVCRVLRYVDDYIVFFEAYSDVIFHSNIYLMQFSIVANGLKFTHEIPVNSSLQFLDLRLLFERGHICWTYSPRTSKALLPHNSAHSKLTKRGVATLCCRSALEKSCQHRVRESLAYQVERMSKAGYPSELIWSCCERILQNVKTEGKGKQPSAAKQPVHVMPYVHRLSHNVKKLANLFGVKTVFTAPCKLAKVCAMMRKEKRSVCNKRS